MTTEFRKGAIFAGRYRIESKLGGGGFATVFEAVDTSFGRRVAIKVLRRDADSSYTGESQGRFERESQTVANLQDPHTVTLFDHGVTDDGLLYMVFEYVEGTQLKSVIDQTGPLDPRIATKIITQVLQSLREAHAAGVLHRDVKPENIIIYEYMEDPYRVKLVDFGLAKPTTPSGGEKLTRPGLVMGTAQYTSPEAYQLQELTPSSDLFAAGLVFYEMLLARPAVDAETPVEIAEKMVRGGEIDVPDTVPEPARSVVARLVRKNPAERFQSADEVLAALQEVPASRDGIRPYGLGGSRDFTAEDFAGEDPEPALDDIAVDRPSLEEVQAADRRATQNRLAPGTDYQPEEEKRTKGGIAGWLGFVLVLTLVLAGVSAAAIHFLDMRMPWEAEPEPVEPATLPAKTFDVASEDTAFFYVDWRQGIVFASSIDEIPASGRCALILDSRSDPTPPGAYFVVEAVDSITQEVTTTAIGRDELARRAELCDLAGRVGGDVVLSAEIVTSELRIKDVERRAAIREARRKRAKQLEAEEVGRRSKFFDALDRAGKMRKMMPGMP